MNLYRGLQRRAAEGKPIRVALIGAGKFGSMFLAQAQRTAGLHVTAIADLSPPRVQAALLKVGWQADRIGARSVAEALRSNATFLGDDALSLIAADGIEVVIEATGNPATGIRHALACCAHRKHVVMVNVEADALAGPLLARRALESGIVYSLAYGDQPALICEMVDWARAAGFDVVAAGKGTKYLPAYHYSTPETVWKHYGFSHEQVTTGDFNAQMFNSFLDGTKSAIEMAAVANATGLTPAPEGLCFPPCGADDLPRVLKPRAEGGTLHHAGQVEVVSSLNRDGSPVARDLRWGVYVTFAADSDYVRHCFAEYGLITDESGEYSAMYKPLHLIGLELGISIASVALRNEPTGVPDGFRADVVAIAKRDLAGGEVLDGEGGATVYGRLMPASDSLKIGGLPVGLAHGAKLIGPALKDEPITFGAIAPLRGEAAEFRKEMERVFA